MNDNQQRNIQFELAYALLDLNLIKSKKLVCIGADVNYYYTESDCNVCGVNGRLLHYFCILSKIDVLKIILKLNPSINKMAGIRNSQTVLHIIFSSANTWLLSIIFDHCMELGIYLEWNARDKKDNTPLHLLVRNDSNTEADIITFIDAITSRISTLSEESLLNAIDWQAVNSSDQTPLDVAINRSMYRLGAKLAELYTHISNENNNILFDKIGYIRNEEIQRRPRPFNPMMYEFIMRNVNQIFDIEQISYNIRQDYINNVYGMNTYLQEAVKYDNDKLVAILVSYGADVFQTTDANITSPILLAAEKGRLSMLKAMCSSLSTPELVSKLFLNIKTTSDENVLHILCRRTFADEENSDYTACLRYLISICADDSTLSKCIGTTDNFGLTPFHVAARENYLEALQIFSKNQIPLGLFTQFDNRGRSVLDIVESSQVSEILDSCIQSSNVTNTRHNAHKPQLQVDFGRFLDKEFSHVSTKSNNYSIDGTLITLDHLAQDTHSHDTLLHPVIQTLLFYLYTRVRSVFIVTTFIYICSILFVIGYICCENLGWFTFASPVHLMLGGIIFLLLIVMFALQHISRGVYASSIRSRFDRHAVDLGTSVHVTSLSFYSPQALCMLVFQFILIGAFFVKLFFPLHKESTLTYHLDAWIVLLCCFVFCLHAGRFPMCVYHLNLFISIACSFAFLFLMYSMIFCAFAYSFYLIVPNESNIFGNFVDSSLRTVVMATGEFDFSSLVNATSGSEAIDILNPRFITGIASISFVLIFFIFVFIVFFVLMNLMTAVAVENSMNLNKRYSLLRNINLLTIILDTHALSWISHYLNQYINCRIAFDLPSTKLLIPNCKHAHRVSFKDRVAIRLCHYLELRNHMRFARFFSLLLMGSRLAYRRTRHSSNLLNDESSVDIFDGVVLDSLQPELSQLLYSVHEQSVRQHENDKIREKLDKLLARL